MLEAEKVTVQTKVKSDTIFFFLRTKKNTLHFVAV